MPLRANINGKDVLAFEQSEESWNELKNSEQKQFLTMPCCGERAIPKTSPLGSFFFSHYRKPQDCDSLPESKEHIYLKGLIAKAAKSTGWDVTTEKYGKTPKGEKWIADVFCSKNKVDIAFEVQLSKQTLADFSHRQKRYKDSGVRAAWFVSEKVEKALTNNIRNLSSKSLPVFVVTGFDAKPPIPIVRDFDTSLEKFIQLLLYGSVQWKTDKDELYVEFFVDSCWSCGSIVKQPCGYFHDVYASSIKSVPNCSRVLEEIKDYVSNENLASCGINQVSAHPELSGNSPDFPYCAECLNCGKPQSNYYLWEKFKIARQNDVLRAEEFIVGECNGRWVVEN